MATLNELPKTSTSKFSTLWYICKFCKRAYLDGDLLWEHKKNEHYDLMLAIRKEKERESQAEYDESDESSDSDYDEDDEPERRKKTHRNKVKSASPTSTSPKSAKSTKVKECAKESVSSSPKKQNGWHKPSPSKDQKGLKSPPTSKGTNGWHGSSPSQGSKRSLETSKSPKALHSSFTSKAPDSHQPSSSKALRSSQEPKPSTSKGYNGASHSVASASRKTAETKSSKCPDKTEKHTVKNGEGNQKQIKAVKGHTTVNGRDQDSSASNLKTIGVQTSGMDEASKDVFDLNKTVNTRKKLVVLDAQIQTAASALHDASTETVAEERKSTTEFGSQITVDLQDRGTQGTVKLQNQYSQCSKPVTVDQASGSDIVCTTDANTQTHVLSKAEASVGTPSVCTVEIGITCDILLPKPTPKPENPLEPDSQGQIDDISSQQELEDCSTKPEDAVLRKLPKSTKLIPVLSIDAVPAPVGDFKCGIEEYKKKFQDRSKSILTLIPIARVRSDTDILVKSRRVREKLSIYRNYRAQALRIQQSGLKRLLVARNQALSKIKEASAVSSTSKSSTSPSTTVNTNDSVRNQSGTEKRKRVSKSPPSPVMKTEVPEDQTEGMESKAMILAETVQPAESHDEPATKKACIADSVHTKFDCWMCAQSFAEVTDLEIHMKQTHLLFSLKLFGCPRCKSSYSTVATLRNHLITTHKLVGLEISAAMSRFRYTCDPCGKVLQYPGYVHHMRTVHMANLRKERLLCFSCDTCKKSFSSKAGLTYHQSTHTRIRERLNCQDCTKSFGSSAGLRYHRSISHELPSFSKISTRKSIPNSTADSGERNTQNLAEVTSPAEVVVKTVCPKSKKRLSCQSCNFKCVFPTRLKRHIELKHPETIQVPSTSSSQQDLPLPQPKSECIGRKTRKSAQSSKAAKLSLRKQACKVEDEPPAKKVLRRKSASISESDSKELRTRRLSTSKLTPSKMTSSKLTAKRTPVKKSPSHSASKVTPIKKTPASSSNRASRRLALTTGRRATRASMPILPRRI